MRLKTMAMALVLLSTTACGLVSATQRMFGSTLPLEVVVSPRANLGNPVAVSLLVVYDRKVLERLIALPAASWFKERDQWRRDFPEAFDVWGWEWVPGQVVRGEELEVRAGARAVLIFADYYTPGSHRASVDPKRGWRLRLEERAFAVEPLAE
ncbi:MAG TPA: type VI secretion protein [Thermoanaerobaculia bacterium]|nr:type VI secretion protein [Thermoanaerobaculia bacterium]